MSRFIKLWTYPDYASVPVGADQLQAAESRLNTRLPLDYRDAIIEFGLPSPAIALLDTICDRDLDLHDVSDFFSPEEIVEHTEGWRDLGLPEELVAFASDCMGNLFRNSTLLDFTRESVRRTRGVLKGVRHEHYRNFPVV